MSHINFVFHSSESVAPGGVGSGFYASALEKCWQEPVCLQVVFSILFNMIYFMIYFSSEGRNIFRAKTPKIQLPMFSFTQMPKGQGSPSL